MKTKNKASVNTANPEHSLISCYGALCIRFIFWTVRIDWYSKDRKWDAIFHRENKKKSVWTAYTDLWMKKIVCGSWNWGLNWGWCSVKCWGWTRSYHCKALWGSWAYMMGSWAPMGLEGLGAEMSLEMQRRHHLPTYIQSRKAKVLKRAKNIRGSIISILWEVCQSWWLANEEE